MDTFLPHQQTEAAATNLIFNPLRIERTCARILVTHRGLVLADSTKTRTLCEVSNPGVICVPRKDVTIARLSRSTTTAICPYKGLALYYSLFDGKSYVQDIAWSYEKPKRPALRISGYLAFDTLRTSLFILPRTRSALKNRAKQGSRVK